MSDISQDFRLADILGAPQDIKAASEPDIGHISEILNDYAGQFLETITLRQEKPRLLGFLLSAE
jgi:hypothetical protein